MEFFAYAIWSALSGCVIIGILLFIYTRIRRKDESGAEQHSQIQEDDAPCLSEERWEQLLDMLHLHQCQAPSGAQERIIWAQDNLGIEPGWLYGGDTSVYPFLSFHNAVARGIEFISSLKDSDPDAVLYVVKPRGVVLAEEVMDACAVLCFAVPLSIPGCEAWRYHPVNVYWEWGYPPERVQCSQLIYTAIQAEMEVKGVEVEPGDIYELVEGKKIPPALLNNPASTWEARVLASAGEDLAGVRKGMLSAQELLNLLSDYGMQQS